MDADRAFALLALLERRVITPGPQLAREMGLDGRALRREMDRLSALHIGLEVVRTRGRSGGYGLGRGERFPPLVIDADEALAIVAALRHLRRHADPRLVWLAGDGDDGGPRRRAPKYGPAEQLLTSADPLLSRVQRLLPSATLAMRGQVERSLALAAEALAAQRAADV